MQQVVQKTGELVNYPCITMLRVLFGSVKSSEDVQQQEFVAAQFKETAFALLRWRYHALPHRAETAQESQSDSRRPSYSGAMFSGRRCPQHSPTDCCALSEKIGSFFHKFSPPTDCCQFTIYDLAIDIPAVAISDVVVSCTMPKLS
jgi:hypothetical protein